MFIESLKTIKLYKRESKLGVMHNYRRHNVVYVLKCNGCKKVFKVSRSKVDQDKVKEDKTHFCGKCASK